MTRYLNRSGNSPIVGYEIEATSILVRFNTGRTYTYTYGSAGSANIENAKQLAIAGRGLSAFITRNMRDKYVR